MKRMPWGRYKSLPFDSLPRHYVAWLKTLPDLDPRLRFAIDQLDTDPNKPRGIPTTEAELVGLVDRWLEDGKARYQYADLEALKAIFWGYRRLRALLGLATGGELREAN